MAFNLFGNLEEILNFTKNCFYLPIYSKIKDFSKYRHDTEVISEVIDNI